MTDKTMARIAVAMMALGIFMTASGLMGFALSFFID